MSPVVAAPLAVKEPLRVVFIRYSSPRFPLNAGVAEQTTPAFQAKPIGCVGRCQPGRVDPAEMRGEKAKRSLMARTPTDAGQSESSKVARPRCRRTPRFSYLCWNLTTNFSRQTWLIREFRALWTPLHTSRFCSQSF